MTTAELLDQAAMHLAPADSPSSREARRLVDVIVARVVARAKKQNTADDSLLAALVLAGAPVIRQQIDEA